MALAIDDLLAGKALDVVLKGVRGAYRAFGEQDALGRPPVIREQMLTELMAPDTLIAATRQSLAATARDTAEQPARHLVSYSGECDLWRARQPPRTSRPTQRRA